MTLLRDLDEPIPDDEDLYRSLGTEDVAGDTVRETAVDLRGTSVYRRKYCDSAEAALADSRLKRPHHTGVAFITPGALPKCTVNEVAWEAFAVDNPEDTEYLAHAEVRVRRESDAPATACRSPNGTSTKLALKHRIAQQMRVAIDPSTGRRMAPVEVPNPTVNAPAVVEGSSESAEAGNDDTSEVGQGGSDDGGDVIPSRDGPEATPA